MEKMFEATKILSATKDSTYEPMSDGVRHFNLRLLSFLLHMMEVFLLELIQGPQVGNLWETKYQINLNHYIREFIAKELEHRHILNTLPI